MKLKNIIDNILYVLFLTISFAMCNAQKKMVSLEFTNKYLNKNNEYKDFSILTRKTLFERIKPSNNYCEIELNYVDKEGKMITYKNILRLSDKDGKSTTLSKSNIGMGSICKPGTCKWYISAKSKFGFIKTINTNQKLKKFIGKIDNEYDAWLLSSSIIGSSPYYPYGKFAKVEDGYLILIPEKESSGHSESFGNKEMIYLVTTFGVIFILK
jgi:hypothetical protein